MQCDAPIWITETSERQGTYVPCNRCYACIQTKRSVWTFRILMEMRVALSAHFLTLTYEVAPTVKQWGYNAMTLQKKDLQLFFKRFRQDIMGEDTYWLKEKKTWNYIENYWPGREEISTYSPHFRYFACGEYGPDTDRPHYHVIAFNIPLDLILYDPIHKEKYSPHIQNIWKHGTIKVADITHGRAHYMTKHHLQPLLLEEYGNREKPFAIMSTKPGIGSNYPTDEIRNYYFNTKNSYATLKNGIKTPLGRYLKEKIYQEGPEGREAGLRSAKYNREREEDYRNSFATETDYLFAQRQKITSGNNKLIRQIKRNNKI